MADATVKIGWENAEAAAGAAAFKRTATDAGKHAESSFSKIGDSASNLFKSLAAPIIGLASLEGVKMLVEEFGAVHDMAARLNETPEVIQRVGQSAAEAGTDIGTVAKAMEKMGNTLADTGNEDTAKALKELGLSAREFAGMNLEERVVALGKAMNKLRDEGEGGSALFRLMGGSAGELIPMLLEVGEAGKVGFDGMVVASSKTVDAMDRVGDKASQLMQHLKGFAATMIVGTMDLIEYGPKGNPDRAKSKDAELEKKKRQAAFDQRDQRSPEQALKLEALQTEILIGQELLNNGGIETQRIKTMQDEIKIKQMEVTLAKTLKLSEEEAHDLAKESVAVAREKAELSKKQAAAMVAEEQKVLELRASGHNKAADKAAKELDIAKRAKSLMEQNGGDSKKAAADARAESDLNERIEKRKKGIIDGRAKLADGAEGGDFRNLDAMKKRTELLTDAIPKFNRDGSKKQTAWDLLQERKGQHGLAGFADAGKHKLPTDPKTALTKTEGLLDKLISRVDALGDS
jgi:hypothetical protein